MIQNRDRTFIKTSMLSAVALTVLAQAIALPPPTGKYSIGVSKHTIEHYNPHDPLAPDNVSTAFLATIYYPTLQIPNGQPAPYLEPELAAIMEMQFNYSAGFLSTFTSTIQPNAPFLKAQAGEPQMPTLLFGPGGGGPPVAGNTILISELVSHGYTVVGLDHPFEQPFIRYPDGTGVVGVDIDYYNPALIEAIYDTRLVDNAVFLEYFPELSRKLGAPFNLTHMGSFGYSLGGAAALAAIYNDNRFVSGLNLDGSLYESLTENSSVADAKKPVFLIGNEFHTGADPDHDVTWESFIKYQTGYFRMITINGSMHHDFCDDTFWKTIMPTDPSTGPVDGNRMYKILNDYVGAFFDFTLLRRNSPLLDGQSAKWPEVVFYNRTV